MLSKEAEKFLSSDILEGMTSISALLNSSCNNDRKIERIWIDSTKKRSKAAEIVFLTAKSKEMDFPVEFINAEKIDALAIGNTHGGILAFCSTRTIPKLSETAIKPNGFYVFLEGIEDPYNFGYSIRSLYAAGVDGIVLPERNWMNSAGVVARSSAGASELIPLYTTDHDSLISLFKNAGYQILCAGIRDSVSIYEEVFHFPVLLIVGGEKRGISRNLLDQADQIVRIEYGRSFRGSLSAASAATVMAFELFRQNKNT